jgi:hypothetical protein
MAYRTFRPEAPTPKATTPAQSTAVEFPLLAAAVPEMTNFPTRASLPSTSTDSLVADLTPPSHSAEIWPLSARAPLSPVSALPVPTSPEPGWRSTHAKRDPAVRRTPLAAVFRMLRAEPTRREPPPEPRAALLQDVFRNL